MKLAAHDIEVKQPKEGALVVVMNGEKGIPYFATYHCGEGEGWFIHNRKEIRATHWRYPNEQVDAASNPKKEGVV